MTRVILGLAALAGCIPKPPRQPLPDVEYVNPWQLVSATRSCDAERGVRSVILAAEWVWEDSARLYCEYTLGWRAGTRVGSDGIETRTGADQVGTGCRSAPGLGPKWIDQPARVNRGDRVYFELVVSGLTDDATLHYLVTAAVRAEPVDYEARPADVGLGAHVVVPPCTTPVADELLQFKQ